MITKINLSQHKNFFQFLAITFAKSDWMFVKGHRFRRQDLKEVFLFV